MAVINVDRVRRHRRGRDVSFTVERGEIFGILGPNGAGKTTTVECVEGLRTPDGGTIRVLGLDPPGPTPSCAGWSASSSRRASCPTRSPSRGAGAVRSFYPEPADWRRCSPTSSASPTSSTTRSEALRRAEAAPVDRARADRQPADRVLDELTTGLDPQARRDTWELIEDIRDRGVTSCWSPTSWRRPSGSATGSP
jgi:ABC-2 type transport system ATP-binding protein